MSLIEQGLVNTLRNNAAVAAIVSARIYPLVVPQNSDYPALVYNRVFGERATVMKGPGGLAQPRFQLSCWATTYADAKSLAEAVRLALDGQGGSWSGVTVQAAIFEGDSDVVDEDIESGKIYYGVHSDFTVWHIEATS